jgi:hypothetical protein
MLIKYTGLSHFRELLQEDFEKLGHAGHEALTWARDEAIEVVHHVAETLLEVLGDEFEKVEADAKEQAPKWSSNLVIAPASTPTE